MSNLSTIPRNQRYQDQEEQSVQCYQCGIGFHCTDAPQMTTSVYWHFGGEQFCSPSCLHDRKGGVYREEWRRPHEEVGDQGSDQGVDDYGYPLSLYEY